MDNDAERYGGAPHAPAAQRYSPLPARRTEAELQDIAYTSPQQSLPKPGAWDTARRVLPEKHAAAVSTPIPEWAQKPGRWADTWAAVASGNYDPRGSRFKRVARNITRFLLLTLWLSTVHNFHVVRKLPTLLVVPIVALWAISGLVVVVVGDRSCNAGRVEVLEATIARIQRWPVAGYEPSAWSIWRGGMLKLSALPVICIWCLLDFMGTYAQGNLLMSVLPAVQLFIGSSGICYVMFRANVHLRTASAATKRFGADVRGLASSLRRGADVEAGQEGRTASEEFERAFDRARVMVSVMNALLSGPLTVMVFLLFMFCVVWLSFVVAIAHEPAWMDRPFAEGAGGTGFLLTFCTVMAVISAVGFVSFITWLAAPGDAYLEVLRDILAPDVMLPLAKAFNREGQEVLAEVLRTSLTDTMLAFEVWSVAWTTKQIVYVVVSSTIAIVLTFAPRFW